MFSTKSLTAAVAAFALVSSSTADYNPSGKGNTAVYWGAGGYQLPLTSYCYDNSIDIIPIAFINSFPAQADGLVGVGMSSNTCNNSPKYPGPGYGGPPNPANDEMWTDCSPLANALYECQQNTKTKFLLSLGGASGNYQLNTEADGVYLANLLWGMFGPYDPAWVAGGGIRPFDASPTKTIEFDGFDFDIETSTNNQAAYVAAINQLRVLFEAHNKKTGCNKEYLITGAPQCPFPDAHMSQMIDLAPFDIIWPQFYNNPGCSARNWVSNGATSGFNFEQWQTDLQSGASKDATLYIGLLGGEQGSASFPGDYLNPTEAKNLLAAYASQQAFGGVMIWDAISSNGTDSPLTGYKYRDGTPIPATAAYYDVIKDLLGAYSTTYTAPAPVCSTSSSSTSSSTQTSTTSSSTTTTSSAAASTTSSSTSTSSAPTTTAAPVHQPSVTADGITCVRIGCYTEGYNIRALTPYATTDYAQMSPEICAANCNVYPYTFIGLEYGGECYCGNQINNGSTIVDDSECNMPCDGFPGEYCGAGDRLDMYQCGPAGTSSTSSASSTTSSAPTSSSSSASSSTSSAAASTSTSSSTSSYPAASSSSSSTSSSAPAAQSSSTSSYPVSSSSSTVSSAPGTYPPSSSSVPSYPTNSSVITGSPYPTITTYPGSPASNTSSTPQSTITETRTTTTVRTISSCAPTVTNCPYGKVLTDTIVLTTTYCPGDRTPSTSTAAAITTSPVQYTTSTVYRTTVYTVTSCAPTVTNCPAKIGQVTTETVIDYTTVCPVTATETGASWSQTNTYFTWTTSSTTTQYVTVKVVPSTATLIPYPVSSAASVLTLNKGVASGTLPAVALYTTTATPSQFTGAASSSRGPVAVVMAVVLGAVALLI